jgi:Ca2+-transporting ATPase
VETLPEPGAEVTVEQDLIFVGLVGMLDPARPEAKAAVQICNQAGIRTVMITGDHPLMARHIAEELDISHNGRYLTGLDLSRLSLAELEQQVEDVSIYARVSPQQKLSIVDALKRRGHIVSMTGDGVNDAPALSKADIGVAMGITGTDVAKEAADMVLLNDNFATIVAAVEEGRVIYDNIRKFIRYNLTGNTSGVVIMLLAPLLAMPLPLRPTQILWINLLADGLLALALSVEPAESDVMRRPPYPPNESVFSRGVGRDIVWVGLLMGIVFLLVGDYFLEARWENWQTMVFSTLAFSRMSLALAMRSERDSLFRQGLLSNQPMLVAVLVTFSLQMAVIYTPWLQGLFETQALTRQELWISLAISTVGFWVVEVQKQFLRWRRK